MHFLLLASIALVGATLGSPILSDLETEWIKFKEQHGKKYKSLLEETNRKQIFSSNYEMIVKHNELYKQGLETYLMGINERADMTRDELKKYSGFKSSGKTVTPIEKVVFKPQQGKIPESLDWRTKGAVTNIKIQGACGSCWAFSATGTLEGQYFLKTGKLVELSEQNILECSFDDGNNGCQGGEMIPAFKYIHRNDGIDSERSYPYNENLQKKCHYQVENNVTSLKGYGVITEGNENDLKAAVAQVGPIAVGIDSTRIDFYSTGVYYDAKCKVKHDDLDHAVLIVGYGTENGQDYWIVKNSWGTSWGERGYIRMSRNRNNNCGIATMASYPLMY